MAANQPYGTHQIHPRQYDIKQHFCRIAGHQSAYQNGKMYISGGVAYLASTEAKRVVGFANEYLRVINTREPFKVGANAPDTQTIEFIKTDPRVPVLDCGALWSYDNELYLFGGKLRNKTGREVADNDGNDPDAADTTIDFVWKYSPRDHSWLTHNNVITLDGNKIKRVWLGGSAVVPSLQKAYFFGGLQYVAEVGDWVPVGDMIIRDFAANTYESQSIPWETRQEGTLAHVQVGHHGILLAFGGSIRWGDPIPMSQIAIFDPESNNFTQRYQPAFAANETSADGTGIPLERGPLCAVVATAKDRSSYQVYIFGGYNDRTDTHLNDVWILSLPSFLWFQASRGTQHPDQGGNEQPTPRYGHRCELVGNGQRTMMVYGGTNRDLKLSECESNGVYAYDLSTLTWLPEYDPGVGEYQVPELVYSVIGGGPDGGATLMPKAGFSDPTVEKLFNPGETKKAGVIAGSVVGAVVGVSLFATTAFLLYKRKKRLERAEEDASNAAAVYQRQLELGAAAMEGFGMADREDTVSPVEVYSPIQIHRPFSTSGQSETKSYEMEAR